MYSKIIWLTQIYIVILLNLLLRPAALLNVQEISPTAVNIFILLLSLIIIPTSLLIYFKEKMIKPVLFGLSTGTTIIVLLIVGFIVMEGAPAFEHTNPIEFITGDTWHIYKSRSLNQTDYLSVEIKNYDVEIIPENDIIYRSANNRSNLSFDIINTGGKRDEYFISYNTSSNLKNVSLNKDYIILEPEEQKTITISFFSSSQGSGFINLICESNQSDILVNNKVEIVLGSNGVKLSPNIIREKQTQMSSTSTKIILKNTGLSTDDYTISVESDSFFRPFVREINSEGNWDFTNKSGNITLEPGESAQLDLKINMINKVVGEYIIKVNAQSNTKPEIIDSSIIYYTQVTKDLFGINDTKKTISLDSKATFFIDTDVNFNVNCRIDGLPSGFESQLIYNNSVVLTGNGKTKVNLTRNNNNLTLIITPINVEEGAYANFSFELKTIETELTLGILEFLIGSFATTVIAILIAAPLGIGVSIFLSEYCHKKIKPSLRFIYDLLAGIPSVVYGLFGYLTLGPLLGTSVFPFLFGSEINSGRYLITASIILSLMILPIIIALSEDAIQSVEKGLKEGSLALGATRWQTMTRVILPKAKSGIIASIILAMGRAIGETMAVSMIMGGSTGMPDLGFPNFFFDRVGTMTSEIALNFGWAIGFPESRAALFAMATMLFIIVFILNGIVSLVRKKASKKQAKKYKKISFKRKIIPLLVSSIFIGKNKKSNDNKFEIINIEKQKKKFIILDKKIPSDNALHAISHNRKRKLIKNQMKSTKIALRTEKIMKIVISSGAVFATLMLLYLIGDIIYRGGSNIQLHFFYEIESFVNPSQGGFLNAILGSLELVILALAVAAPLSIGSAIYIVEYAKRENIFTKIILFTSDTLASTPSIVFGAFGYVFFIFFLDFQQSLFVGGLTLGFMVIPLLLRSSIESLKSIPDSYREGSLALGATKWQTIRNAVIPPASPGISSGVIISIGRAIGETAAVIFTAGYLRNLAHSILDPVGSMPNLIFTYYSQALSFPELGAKVYSAAMVLLIIVIILNLISKLSARRAKKMLME